VPSSCGTILARVTPRGQVGHIAVPARAVREGRGDFISVEKGNMLTIAKSNDSWPRFGRTMQDHLSAGSLALAIPNSGTSVAVGFCRNGEVYREGEHTGPLYKVISGTVRTCKVLIDGRRQIGSFYLQGEIFGLEVEREHSFSAEAVVDSEVLIIKSSTVPCERWRTEMMWALMGHELKRAQDHARLLAMTARERVAGFLLEMAERIQSSGEVELPMSRQDIADYLGLTVETVSRMLTQLKNRAVIAVPTSKRIVLRKRAALNRLVA
jgi:CRP/FNR family transcriptional regulator, nitrogen fixation regulation protein